MTDRNIDFQFGWRCPSCERTFNPKIDECKYCNYSEEKYMSDTKCDHSITPHDLGCLCELCKTKYMQNPEPKKEHSEEYRKSYLPYKINSRRRDL